MNEFQKIIDEFKVCKESLKILKKEEYKAQYINLIQRLQCKPSWKDGYFENLKTIPRTVIKDQNNLER